jgi:hypothetical protein
MTANALAARLESQAAVGNLWLCVISGVALQAELASFPSHQEHSIRTPVRVVAGDAASDFQGRMLEDVRSALFDMALHARFQPGAVEAGQI